VGEGLPGFERSQNSLDHAIGIAENIVVPKPEHSPTLDLEPSRPGCVCCVLGMLTTIDFDYQLVLGTGEVDDEIAHRMLSPEFVLQ
jgi:hypothetical protein